MQCPQHHKEERKPGGLKEELLLSDFQQHWPLTSYVFTNMFSLKPWRPSDTACGWEGLESVCLTPEGNMCTSGRKTAVPSTLDQRLFKGKMEAV